MRICLITLLLLATIVPTARAKDGACSNPKSMRVGIFVTADPKRSDSDLDLNYQRQITVEHRFRQALIGQFPSDVICVVEDVDVFSDPTNYPLLKGSVFFKVTARPSFKDLELSAIAVDISISQGAYFDQNIPLGGVPVLIEKDSDYDLGAKAAVMFWSHMTEAIMEDSHKGDAVAKSAP